MKALFFFILLSILSVSCTKSVNSKTPGQSLNAFVITHYGASPGLSDNTISVQQTIDTCAAAGGGTVIVPSGVFLCGPISMKSNVNLTLQSGAVLTMLPYGAYPTNGSARLKAFIDCTGISNFAISGPGTIEGQGAAWWTAFRNDKSTARPSVIRLTNSVHAEISGLTIQNSPNVHIVVGRQCDAINIAGVIINSPSDSPNTDGIDIWSPDVNISNCQINCGDDNIAVDSYSNNVNITSCSFGTGHGCSVGSYTTNVHDITVNNCTFNGTTSGVRIKSNRGRSGLVQNITYSNIKMTNVTHAIGITCYYPKTPVNPTADPAQPIDSLTPNFKNITLKNITAVNSGDVGTIWGLPELSISNLIFDNVTINAVGGMIANYASGIVFKNGSRITVSSGPAIKSYGASISGIDLVSGKAQ